MRVETSGRITAEGAAALASHFRDHPEAIDYDPHVLASRFGLTETFVEHVLQGLRGQGKNEARQPIQLSGVKRTLKALRKGLYFLIQKPLLFVAITTLIGIIAHFQLPVDPATHQVDSRTEILFNGSVTIVFIAHLAAYYRHTKARTAMLGGLIFWLITASVTMILVYQMTMQRPPGGAMTVPFMLLGSSMGWLAVAVKYAGFGMLAAVIGGYVHLRKSQAAEEELTRQELLERYFEIKERVAKSKEAALGPQNILERPTAILLSQWMPLYAAGFAIVLGGLRLLIVGALYRSDPIQTTPVVELGQQLFDIFALSGMILCAFLSKNLIKAVLSTLLIKLITIGTNLLLLEIFNDVYFRSDLHGRAPFWAAFDVIVIALAGTAAAMVKERHARILRLEQEDPATLVSEMVRIQWRLHSGASEVTVMVVDVAASTFMKADADPLAVEYSFREYQQLITDVSAHFEGQVHSTAGDGAVVAFPNASLAHSAAKNVLLGMETFNKKVNRLRQPFRVRIGLHTGPVAGELDEVEFTEVIDIAAHVQAAAPVGKIALTRKTATDLNDVHFIPLEGKVDGYEVLVSNGHGAA